MLDSLYSEAIKKKGQINDSLDNLSEIKELDIDRIWFEEFISPSSKNVKIAAGDGSYGKKKYLSFNFYAVAAVSYIYDGKLEKIESVEVDTMPHQSFIDDRLRNIMSIFELKNAIKTLNNYEIDYYLDDGSLLGDLIRPFPVEKKISKENKSKIIEVFRNKIQKEIENDEVNLSSSKFKDDFADLFDEDILEDDALVLFLENIEKLLTLATLLKNKRKIIAISKTSSSNDLLHFNIPDMAVLDKFSKKEGFSKPYYKKLSSEMKRDFPVENEFFRELEFTVFFARLEEFKNILKIELPYKASEDEIRQILSDIKKDATDGYPYLLKKAHNDVVIKNKNIDELSNIIGFIEKSGREMLN